MRYSTYNAIPQYPKSKKHPYENLAKQGISGQKGVKHNYDKSTTHLPRQCLRDGMKALILLGFLNGSVEFTPYLHL